MVSCHGGISSRLDVIPAARAAAGLGVRIVSPDRPGVGGSTRDPGRCILDRPMDVTDLADHLCHDRFAVIGWSMGGMHAQARAVRGAAQRPRARSGSSPA